MSTHAVMPLESRAFNRGHAVYLVLASRHGVTWVCDCNAIEVFPINRAPQFDKATVEAWHTGKVAR